jgi:DNA repair exonuclease SbcCD ATPase subunit
MDAKMSVIENLNTQITQIQATMKADRSKIADLEAQNNSLSSQIETKSMIVHNCEHQIEDLRQTNKHLNRTLTRFETSPDVHVKLSHLEAENAELREKYASNAALLETKSLFISDLNRQVGNLKTSNDILSNKIARLENSSSVTVQHKDEEIREIRQAQKSLSSSYSSQIQAKSSVIESLKKENQELALKLSDLEDDRRSSILSSSEENRSLQIELKTVAKENRRLTRMGEELRRQLDDVHSHLRDYQTIRKQNKTLKRENERLSTELDSMNRSSLLQKDEVIKQLRSLVASQATSIAAYERTRKVKDEKTTLDDLIVQLEKSLLDFPIDIGIGVYSGTKRERLMNLIDGIRQVRTLVEEQRQSIDRLTTLSSTQHATLVRMTKSTYDKK